MPTSSSTNKPTKQDPNSYSWANKCILMGIVFVVMGFVVSLIGLVGIVFLVASIILYAQVYFRRKKQKKK